jgi:hypothetical protein
MAMSPDSPDTFDTLLNCTQKPYSKSYRNSFKKFIQKVSNKVISKINKKFNFFIFWTFSKGKL